MGTSTADGETQWKWAVMMKMDKLGRFWWNLENNFLGSYCWNLEINFLGRFWWNLENNFLGSYCWNLEINFLGRFWWNLEIIFWGWYDVIWKNIGLTWTWYWFETGSVKDPKPGSNCLLHLRPFGLRLLDRCEHGFIFAMPWEDLTCFVCCIGSVPYSHRKR